MNHPQPLLTLSDVTKEYPSQRALTNVSLTVLPGEKIALVGPSGSGKSTLLNILVKVQPLTSGKVEIEGMPIQSIHSAKDYAKLIGLLPQQFNLISTLSVLHNVLVGRMNEWNTVTSLWSLLFPQDQSVALSALKKVGLEDKKDFLVKHLSGGQQQRVAIARLLVQNPRIILADEPVASLDPANAQRVLKLLIQLTTADQTLIASMHSLDLALTYFDRIVGLKDGHIIFDLPSSKVSSKSLSELYGEEFR